MHNEELLRQASLVDVHQVGFHPIIRAYMQQINLVELINSMVKTTMQVEPGIIVAGMIQDTLSGRSPLYHLKDFFSGHDTGLLLGKTVNPDDFSDYNVGRVLDRIKKVGPSRIFAEVARRASVIHHIDTSCGHWDSTSVSVWGDYDYQPDEGRINITYGYSKDQRPDLKQFMISMLCVENNIPMLGETQDGNSSDKTLNKKLLSRISGNLSHNGLGEGAFTYTADSAMVTEDNLACFDPMPGQPPFYFVTRMPFSYKEAKQVVKNAVHADQWQDIGVLARESSPKRPPAFYRAHETQVEMYNRTFRAIVVHSRAHDTRRQNSIDRKLNKAREDLEKALASSLKTAFSCQDDAQAEINRLLAIPQPCHQIEAHIKEQITYAPGRPAKDGTRKIKDRRWRILVNITENTETVARMREEAGCFVLLSNRPHQGPDEQNARQLLQTYKGQDGVERNFSFLKDPLIVNDLFLKKPERVEALGMILLLALLIWNLMQRQMRNFLEKQDSTLEGLDGKPTKRPTSYMMTTKFRFILVLRSGGSRLLKKPLSKTQKEYLRALGLKESIYTSIHPPPFLSQ